MVEKLVAVKRMRLNRMRSEIAKAPIREPPWAIRKERSRRPHRRIKGLRLVTAYGNAAALGTLQDVTHGLPGATLVGSLAGSFALWASVSEARVARAESSRDLAPLLAWDAAAVAMIVYAMALPNRYDIASAAFAFTLIVTLAIGGVHSISLLGARAWETLLGGAFGLLAAKFIFPLRS